MKLRKLNGENTNLQFKAKSLEPDMSIATIPEDKANKEIKNGTFTYANAKEAYPDEYSVCAVAMTGAEIKEMLEYNSEHKYEVKYDENGNKIIDINGDKKNISVPYGLNFHYQMDRPVGSKVIIEGFANGKEFDPNEVYVVMVNNYIINSSETQVYETLG